MSFLVWFQAKQLDSSCRCSIIKALTVYQGEFEGAGSRPKGGLMIIIPSESVVMFSDSVMFDPLPTLLQQQRANHSSSPHALS